MRGDVRLFLDLDWELMIAHPECRRLCNSGVLRLYVGGKKINGRDSSKWRDMVQAAAFYVELAQAPIPRIVIENSIMHGYAKAIIEPHITRWGRQIIQPHQFGEDASKGTLLRMKNVPDLLPTKAIAPRLVDGKPRWANQTDSGQNKLPPSAARSALRAPRCAQELIPALPMRWRNSGAA